MAEAAPELLLCLQLLALAALVFALARPFWLGATPLGANLVAIVDVSGSMNATDIEPSRIERAKEEIRKLIDSLPANGQMTIITAGTGAEVLQSATGNRAALRVARRTAWPPARPGRPTSPRRWRWPRPPPSACRTPPS